MDAIRNKDCYTYEEYCKLGDGIQQELIDGTLVTVNSDDFPEHQSVLIALFKILSTFLDGKAGRVFSAPIKVRLNANDYSETVVQPDILVICDEKKLLNGTEIISPPDLIVEVLSPSSSRHDRITKFKLYNKAAVREYWIVDPIDKTVIVYVLHGNKYAVNAYESKDSVPVNMLDGCVVNLSEVFTDI